MAGDWTSLRQAAAEWTFGRRPIEDMPAAASDALVAGCDSPSLARLAAMEGASWSEIEPLTRRVLAELGWPVSDDDTRRHLANGWLERVADGRVEPGRHYDYELHEILGGLGGEYAWFAHALYDLETRYGMGEQASIDALVAEIRVRAWALLERSGADEVNE